ncbi:MAG: diphosphomevalonate decarboxylase [Erysipelothrix sp.]|nr:diphosphomevalonate decarboxylase [Erysipelothrix sp.]
MKQVIGKANINIALCKYWGKADPVLVYPTTTSISFTLDKFYTVTTITAQANQDQHTIDINHKPANAGDVEKVSKFLEHFSDGEKVHVSSINHVPIKAGLASSASAYAALAIAANTYFKKHYEPARLAQVTRFGSGSAARSIFSHFVKWEANSDRILPIDAPMMDLGMFVIMIDASEKRIASRQAMEISKTTSWIYKEWVKRANEQAQVMEAAIKKQDFHQIGSIAQDNALSMHMTMMSSKPSIVYFQPETIEIMHHLLTLQATCKDFYFTMDAGPNIKVLVMHQDKEVVRNKLLKFVTPEKLIYSHYGREAHLLEP